MALGAELISITDVRTLRDVDANFEEARFSAYLKEVQEINLRQLLGDSLWLDFFSNVPDSGKYDELLAGKTYTFNAEFIRYFGLKPFLIWAWIGKATREGNIWHTARGTYDFNPDTVQRNSRGEINNAIEGYKYNMQVQSNDIKKFLNENASTYPLWKGKSQRNATGLSIDVI